MSLSGLCADPAAARRALDARQVGVVELVQAALARADELQPTIGAFAEITQELALAQAQRAQEALLAAARAVPCTASRSPSRT